MAKLTKRFIDKLEALSKNPGKDLVLWDDDITGFGIRVKPSGVKSYIIQYRDGRQSCRMTLGHHGVLTPEEARKQARIELGNAAKGGNPARDRKEDREASNMREFADDYMERHALPNKRPRPAREDRSMLDRIVLPNQGDATVRSGNSHQSIRQPVCPRALLQVFLPVSARSWPQAVQDLPCVGAIRW